jgi:hypothetical protein
VIRLHKFRPTATDYSRFYPNSQINQQVKNFIFANNSSTLDTLKYKACPKTPATLTEAEDSFMLSYIPDIAGMECPCRKEAFRGFEIATAEQET